MRLLNQITTMILVQLSGDTAVDSHGNIHVFTENSHPYGCTDGKATSLQVRNVQRGSTWRYVALLFITEVRGEAGTDTRTKFITAISTTHLHSPIPRSRSPLPFHSRQISVCSPSFLSMYPAHFNRLLDSFLPKLFHTNQPPPSTPPFFACLFFSLPQFCSPSYLCKLALSLVVFPLAP